MKTTANWAPTTSGWPTHGDPAGSSGLGVRPFDYGPGVGDVLDHDHSPVRFTRPTLAPAAFPRTAKTLFQSLNMPDDTWNPKGLDIPLRRPFEIFIPNVCAIDMDTTGTWPYGRRPEDQVATRLLPMFLDMSV